MAAAVRIALPVFGGMRGETNISLNTTPGMIATSHPGKLHSTKGVIDYVQLRYSLLQTGFGLVDSTARWVVPGFVVPGFVVFVRRVRRLVVYQKT